MPIKPELRGFYPIDWHELSRSIRFRRAKGACERYGRPHGKIVCILADGRWFDEERVQWRATGGASAFARTWTFPQNCRRALAIARRRS